MRALLLCVSLMIGDVMPIGTLIELPRDVWVQIDTRGGRHIEGFLVDATDDRVVIDAGELRYYVRPAAIDSVAVPND